jgi:hypothetical protein
LTLQKHFDDVIKQTAIKQSQNNSSSRSHDGSSRGSRAQEIGGSGKAVAGESSSSSDSRDGSSSTQPDVLVREGSGAVDGAATGTYDQRGASTASGAGSRVHHHRVW